MKPPLPLRAFPFPLNVGTDICQISRVRRILDSPRRTRFINRILAPEELESHKARLDPSPGTILAKDAQIGGRGGETPPWETAAFLAGRFAAKEAAIKAHPHRQLSFHDVVIERRMGKAQRLGSGPPVARIRAANGEGEDVSALISISHDGDYATAVCIAHDPS
ncbi:uncharacterized protein UV8b_04246 [Ustilaginoidea virens]|uniref:4'-phosphopantetheinyl transferase domain-containing protein n=1 Tax=Ustilaginoidea virens TaxID=1159556 RepID=A0A8E5HQV9_USTVR|nr:uncharacterized protein UV8b_04246 [Ustilaginoidea virens]QUC20005.1 hypothetical protein UV8b_04246 [Ustilaginoidea virens]